MKKKVRRSADFAFYSSISYNLSAHVKLVPLKSIRSYKPNQTPNFHLTPDDCLHSTDDLKREP